MDLEMEDAQRQYDDAQKLNQKPIDEDDIQVEEVEVQIHVGDTDKNSAQIESKKEE